MPDYASIGTLVRQGSDVGGGHESPLGDAAPPPHAPLGPGQPRRQATVRRPAQQLQQADQVTSVVVVPLDQLEDWRPCHFRSFKDIILISMFNPEVFKLLDIFSTFRKINIWQVFKYFGIGTIFIQNLRIHEICCNISHSSLRKPKSLVKKRMENKHQRR